MLVKMYGIFKDELETSIEIDAPDMRQLLAQLTFRLGDEKTQILYKIPLYYILGKKTSEELLVIDPKFPLFEFGNYDVLHFVPEVSGDIPIPLIIMGVLASISTAIGVSVPTLVLVMNAIIFTAISAVVQLLSATPEFSSDPSKAQLQKSSLFNGIRQTTEQGGCVPIIYGRPFTTGVAISVGLYNEQFTAD